MSDDQPTSRTRPKKRTPAHFQINGASLVQNLLAGADDVAGRSFLGGGGATPVLGGIAPASSDSAEPDIPPPSGADLSTSTVLPPVGTGEPKPAAARNPGPKPETKAEPASADESWPVAGLQRGQRSCSPWAHQAVHESFADAKLRSAKWKSHGFRITPEVLSRLRERVNVDRRTTGNFNLAIGHYVDAALRHIPPSVGDQIAIAEAFGESQLWDTEKTQPSTYRVGEKAYGIASNLKLTLQEADFGRRGTQVVSAAIERFLDVLETEGPLNRPERRQR
ncbi:hypothetical protein [Streptomyces sp. NPDC060022]|uniref:hypothetical protein n=1 Tax=Streptomyces sp. NPDC060022 TaxID=3347039 RepID=UPI0036755BEE